MNQQFKARIARLLFLLKTRDELLLLIPGAPAMVAVLYHYKCLKWNQEILAGCLHFLERMPA